jgi:phosphoglycerol transferase MdoB-like AlkP superfamily enzyme
MAFILSLARLGFMFYFGDVKALMGDLKGLRHAFFLGLRYDLMPLSYICAFPLLILNISYFLPGKGTIKAARLINVLFLTLGFYLVGWITFVDYAFYSYFQDHLNILFFGFFEDDTIAVITSIWKNYNVVLWLPVVLFVHWAFYRIVKFCFSPYDFDLDAKKFSWRMPTAFVSSFLLLAFFARGNFTRLALSLEDSHISQNEFINKLSLSGIISFNRAMKIRRTYGNAKFDYLHDYGYADWKTAFKDAFKEEPASDKLKPSLKKTTPTNEALKARPPHVIMVVMESFGSYWNEDEAKTFNILGSLKDHLNDGILFRNFLPAENGTIGSIVSVASSQVIRPGARYLSESEFMNTTLGTAGHKPFKDAGYQTHFIYGGKLGWRDLGKFLTVQGFDRLWGADEIKESMPELTNFNDRDLGNEWGIFDEYLYSFIEEQLRTATTPQFFLVLTTSNHPPFEYPTSYRPLPMVLDQGIMEKITVDKDLATKRFMGMQYANQKMGEFISRLKNADNENFVLALTGDHSFWIAKGVGQDRDFKKYAVPFFLTMSESYKPKSIDLTRFGSHEDIFPTLYHLSLSNSSYLGIGENLLGSRETFAMNSSGLVANKKGAYHHGQFWKWKDMSKQILEPAPQTPELLELKKHAEGLISITDLYLKNEKIGTPADGGSGRQE